MKSKDGCLKDNSEVKGWLWFFSQTKFASFIIESSLVMVRTMLDVKCSFVWSRGGVKLEFVRNSFNSIRKFAIRLIRKGKKYLINSMKINSKFIRFDSNYRVGQIFQMLDSFEIRSIWFENLRMGWFEKQKIFEKFNEN